MKCACCGKRKCFFESFAPLNDSLNVCIKCDTVLCRINDAEKNDNLSQFNQNVAIINENIKKTHNIEFYEWFDNYLKKISNPIDNVGNFDENKDSN